MAIQPQVGVFGPLSATGLVRWTLIRAQAMYLDIFSLFGSVIQSPPPPRTYIHTHTTHTHSHTHTLTNKHTRTHTHIDSQTNKHRHTHTHTHALTNKHTHTHTHTNKHTHTNTHTHTHTSTHTNKKNQEKANNSLTKLGGVMGKTLSLTFLQLACFQTSFKNE